ncbi:bifunctional transcriptional activator/DNA repair enzyme AdaA [Listeria ilorinensis]|uniref:bifunctional transcriptional activator/DNA repair enzyme AdaA n=1 Tax=Listeria ilorinensis TaxID=2867439 RepID=UPI001EF6D284|nr:trifunctional transcriptional activator/DNA repair protein Ada/methylated-DNA--[protein]-cysteine S-methyltransferase [Listeria ilorinensis]
MITSADRKQEFYQALVEKNPAYDGIFFAGIKTTGIFCHATCTARKPKFENCSFYLTAQEALLAGFRPCKICRPLSFPQTIPEEVQLLIREVERHPEKRWREADFTQLGLHSATARRKFKSIYGMTFVQYARARRMGMAFKEIMDGSKVIDQQLAVGYDSSSGFNDAFTKIMGNPAKKAKIQIVNAYFISTPIGRMLSLSDEQYLYLLEFVDRRGLEKEIEKLRQKHNIRIIHGQNSINQELERQLGLYFEQKLVEFSVPLFKEGSEFQKQVWEVLESIPAGTTMSYQDIARKLGNKNKVRAIGNANGANRIAILIPCHRVILTDGGLGGYGGGVERKKYLIALEQWARQA